MSRSHYNLSIISAESTGESASTLIKCDNPDSNRLENLMAKKSAANKKGSATAGSKRTKKYVPKYLHVVYRRSEGWIIRNQNYRTLSTHNTRREALEVARPLAKKNELTLVIHRRNNRVMKWECYYRGPIPPPQPPRVRPPGPARTAIRKAIRKAFIAAANERRLANEQQVKSQSGRSRKHATTSKAN